MSSRTKSASKHEAKTGESATPGETTATATATATAEAVAATGSATVAVASETAPPASDAVASKSEGPSTLCIDIGGTGVKAIVLDAHGQPLCERQRVPTPRPATPQALLAVIESFIGAVPGFDRVSVGFPGVVKQGVVHTAPNLDEGWAGFALAAEIEQRTSKPTRVLNDAGVQGYGAISGQGTEMILTLGTGMGCAIFVDGRYVPNVELAHHPLRKGRTYEEYVCNDELKRIGKRRWRKRVQRVIEQVLPIFNPDVLYLGGGNARLLEDGLPPQVKRVENIAGLMGGIALWSYPR